MPLAPLPWIFINLDGAVAWILAVAAPIVIMVVWRLGLSPRARFAWPAPLRWALQLIVLALGPVALFAVGWNRIAWALLILATVGAVIIRLWEPPRRADPT